LDGAISIVKRTLETGYTCLLESLSHFIETTPWSDAATDLYSHLAASACKLGIHTDVAENILFATLVHGQRGVHIVSPQKVDQVAYRVASRSGHGAYSPLRMAVEVVSCNLPVQVMHARHLGGSRFDPVLRRFSDSQYDPSLVASEKALHDGDDFALIGAVADGQMPRLWSVVRADRSLQTARLLKESGDFLSKLASLLTASAPRIVEFPGAAAASSLFENARAEETQPGAAQISWSEASCDVVVGKAGSIIASERGSVIIPTDAKNRIDRYAFTHEGSTWRVCFGNEEGTVKTTLGARYVAELLRRPGKSTSIADLLGIDVTLARQAIGIPYPILDDKAIEAFRSRLDQLRAENPSTPQIVDEIDELEAQLKRATVGTGGVRSLGRSRATHNIRTNIRRFICGVSNDRLRQFKHHLGAHIRTSGAFRYDPPPGFPRWDVFF